MINGFDTITRQQIDDWFEAAIHEMSHGTPEQRAMPDVPRVRYIAEGACVILGDNYTVEGVYVRGDTIRVTLCKREGQREWVSWYCFGRPMLRSLGDAALRRGLVDMVKRSKSGEPTPKYIPDK